jgi:transcriptional regulator with XRE-family HTH domain
METPALIREALRTAGCSRAELARRAGIAPSVLSAYEHGRREPSVASLDAVLAAAGLELAPRRRLRAVDEARAERELLDVLSFVDGLPFSPRRTPLRYPSLLA